MIPDHDGKVQPADGQKGDPGQEKALPLFVKIDEERDTSTVGFHFDHKVFWIDVSVKNLGLVVHFMMNINQALERTIECSPICDGRQMNEEGLHHNCTVDPIVCVGIRVHYSLHSVV